MCRKSDFEKKVVQTRYALSDDATVIKAELMKEKRLLNIVCSSLDRETTSSLLGRVG